MAAHQEVTRQWWQDRKGEFDLFYRQAVRQKSAMGDSAAAALRLTLLDNLVLLEIPAQAIGLANKQVAGKVRQVCESFGQVCPVLCSPLELTEVN